MLQPAKWRLLGDSSSCKAHHRPLAPAAGGELWTQGEALKSPTCGSATRWSCLVQPPPALTGGCVSRCGVSSFVMGKVQGGRLGVGNTGANLNIPCVGLLGVTFRPGLRCCQPLRRRCFWQHLWLLGGFLCGMTLRSRKEGKREC